jgi:hypothetical protein
MEPEHLVGHPLDAHPVDIRGDGHTVVVMAACLAVQE